VRKTLLQAVDKIREFSRRADLHQKPPRRDHPSSALTHARL